MIAATDLKSSQGWLLGAAITLFCQGSTAVGQKLTPSDIQKLPSCSIAKVNHECKLSVDRTNPVVPPQIQLYSNQRLAVIIKSPRSFERYFLDPVSGQQTLYPDTGSVILQGLLPSLAKIGEFRAQDASNAQDLKQDKCRVDSITGAAIPAATKVPTVLSDFSQCATQLAKKAITIYQSIEPFIAPDALTPDGYATEPDPNTVVPEIDSFVKSEIAMSSKISAISGDANLKISAPDQPAILELTDLQKLTDAITTDLLSYRQRIKDLKEFKNGAQPCAGLMSVTEEEKARNIQCVVITSNKDDDSVNQNMVSRTITYSVDMYNEVSYSQEAAVDPTKKKSLGNIVLNFADIPYKAAAGSRNSAALKWEASAGVLFSSLPIRSFSASPVFTGAVVTDNTVTQSILRPTVVPFAAGNYRISNDLGWTRWKSALYLTGGIGINPNTVSADFAAGLSVSWRTLMFSPLWHLGHDVRLTQGLTVNESLGASFKGSLPTQNYWKSSFAVGISVRVPPITGR